MMKIITGLGEDGFFRVTINTPLLERYYSNLVGMIKRDKDCPKDISIQRTDSKTVFLQFQMGEGGQRGTPVDGKIGVDEVGAKPLADILSIAKRFSIAAYRHLMKSCEFIPLSGYPISDLQNDIINALDNKRSFVIIDTFEHYKELMKDPGKEFKQYVIPYESDEYTNVFLQVRRGDMRGLKKLYSPKLKNYNWI